MRTTTEIEYMNGDTVQISGEFGTVTISPRDPAMGKGTFISLDADGTLDAPTVLMVGDRIERYAAGNPIKGKS